MERFGEPLLEKKKVFRSGKGRQVPCLNWIDSSLIPALEAGMMLELPVQYELAGTMKKVGRNDLCPCGSGKKFKKCCESKMLGGRFKATPVTQESAPLVQKATGLTSLFHASTSAIPKKKSPPDASSEGSTSSSQESPQKPSV